MEDLTILTVFWNQQKAVELCLKTYVKHHYSDIPLKCLFVDNGSTDGTKNWLRKNEIPFIDLPRNVGHQEVINLMWNKVQTRYLLLVDSDVEFQANVFEYLTFLTGDCVSVGTELHNPPLHPRIGPWFWLLDLHRIKNSGVRAFRGDGCTDWSYDCGSWLWEKILQNRFTNHNISYTMWPVGQHYAKFIHYSQVSTAADPDHNIQMRRGQIAERAKQDIELRGRFTGETAVWTDDFLTAQMAKGWYPIFL